MMIHDVIHKFIYDLEQKKTVSSKVRKNAGNG